MDMPSQRPVSHAGSITHAGSSGVMRSPQTQVREKFAADELAIVLSHYDIGVVQSIAEFPRGSRRAPKLLIASERGKFLLKRRARGKDDPFKVAFAHAIQLFLTAKQFPVPHLIGTRNFNNSMLQWRNGVYELFEYIPGQNYPQTLESTADAGRVLGLYHKLLADFKSQWQPSSGSYHLASAVEQALKTIGGVSTPTTGAAALPPPADGLDVRQLLNDLFQSYRKAGEAAQAQGVDKLPATIVHADWHPGNMLFRENRVVAVIDHDSARQLPRALDVANGLLQFSIIGGEEDVSQWPPYLDESRYHWFVRGYRQVMGLSEPEARAIPQLMIEALIAEAVFPIAQTGAIGRLDGVPFLQMVMRKVRWIEQAADKLGKLVHQH
jgi:Ser/Thr protein kinase RdoA (MazF antagonist)